MEKHVKQQWLDEKDCPICGDKDPKFPARDFSHQCDHLNRHRAWRRLLLWCQVRVPLSELLYARKYPKRSYLTPPASEQNQEPTS